LLKIDFFSSQSIFYHNYHKQAIIRRLVAPGKALGKALGKDPGAGQDNTLAVGPEAGPGKVWLGWVQAYPLVQPKDYRQLQR
jgi:hypothetical protein